MNEVTNLLNLCQNGIELLRYTVFTFAMSDDRRQQQTLLKINSAKPKSNVNIILDICHRSCIYQKKQYYKTDRIMKQKIFSILGQSTPELSFIQL